MLMFHLDDRRLMEEKRKAQKAGKVLARDALDWNRPDVRNRWEAAREWRLVIAAQNGDRDAFPQLFAPYRIELWTLCYRLANRQREDAEDLSQETLCKALDKINTFQPGKRFGPWLFRIATNTYIDWIRSKKRQGEQVGVIVSLENSIGGDEDEGIALVEQLADETMDPAEEVALRETFKKCWSKLDSNEQEVLALCYRWDVTFKQLGWLKGSKHLSPGDDEETKRKKQQSAHQNGRYYVRVALQRLEESLRSGGLDLDSSQVRQLIEEQSTKGGVTQ